MFKSEEREREVDREREREREKGLRKKEERCRTST